MDVLLNPFKNYLRDSDSGFHEQYRRANAVCIPTPIAFCASELLGGGSGFPCLAARGIDATGLATCGIGKKSEFWAAHHREHIAYKCQAMRMLMARDPMSKITKELNRILRLLLAPAAEDVDTFSNLAPEESATDGVPVGFGVYRWSGGFFENTLVLVYDACGEWNVAVPDDALAHAFDYMAHAWFDESDDAEFKRYAAKVRCDFRDLFFTVERGDGVHLLMGISNIERALDDEFRYSGITLRPSNEITAALATLELFNAKFRFCGKTIPLLQFRAGRGKVVVLTPTEGAKAYMSLRAGGRRVERKVSGPLVLPDMLFVIADMYMEARCVPVDE